MANTTSQGGAKSKGKSKGKIVNLEELCGSTINWAEEVENEAQNDSGPTTTTTVEIKTKFTHARMSLPSAPKASRGDVIIDMDNLPVDGPYVAYMGNIAYNANDRAIHEFFSGLEVVNIRTMMDNGRPKGYCYIEFGSRMDLAEALKRNNERLAGRPVRIDLADQERGGERKKSYEQHPSGQQSGGRQRYTVAGEAGGQAEAANDWRAESRPYGPPPVHAMTPRDRGPPPSAHQDMHPYATMPAGRPPPAPYANSRYANDRPDYGNRQGYVQPAPQASQQPYGHGQGPPPGAVYYPPPYGDPVGGSTQMDQRYYNPNDHRKRRDNEYGRYNTLGGRPPRERDPRYDQGYESERDYDHQSNYRYRQEYNSGGRMGPPPHRGGGPPTPNAAGYPMYRQGSYGAGGYGSDSDASYHRQKTGGDPYARGNGANYPYPPYHQQQQPFRMYQDNMDPGDRRGVAPPRRDYGPNVGPRRGGGPPAGGRPARREHRLSTASTVSVDESIIEGGETQKERPKLQLQPRTKPVAEVAAPIEKSSSGIFGNAKPIDTRQLDEKIEEKIRKLKETEKRSSVTTSASESDIGTLQKPGSIQSHRNSSVNSSRSSPVEDPKPSITPSTPTAVAGPDDVKFAPGAVKILRRRTTSSQNDESSATSTLKSDDATTMVEQRPAGDKPADQVKNANDASEKSSENVPNRSGGDRRRGDGSYRRGSGQHHNGHRGGRMYADRPPRFQQEAKFQDPRIQEAKFQDERPKDYERRGSQDSLIFTRGGGGRNKGRRGFSGASGGQGRGRSFDEGDSKAYQHLDPQAQQQAPLPNVRRQNSHRHSIDRQDSKPRQDDDSQAPPVPQQQVQRKKSRENKPVEKKPSTIAIVNDDPPVSDPYYTG